MLLLTLRLTIDRTFKSLLGKDLPAGICRTQNRKDTQLEELVVEPSVDLLASLRSVGYSTQAAVADIIDNSLDANATRVDIDVDVVGGEYIAILDDGEGMDGSRAEEALRLGGTAGDDRPGRLGRFGLGLKTASLSQARLVTVVTKKKGEMTALCWDLDHVAKSRSWALLKLDKSEVKALPMAKKLLQQPNGTLVIWSKLDLLLGDAQDPSVALSAEISRLLSHIGLTYHRYLSRTTKQIAITLNGVAISPVDPFLKSNPKTQFTPQESLQVGSSEVRFRAFTLPHFSHLTPSERRRNDLGEGMRLDQGFYIYRNERLISKGHWFGLASMSELNKLTRIQVDVPRELDHLWQLDIKKSRTEPPASFKIHLKKMMDPIMTKGKRVNSFRGRTEKATGVIHVWDKVRDRDGFRYEVNVDNPVVKATLAKLETSQAESVIALLGLIADHYPHLDLYNEIAGNVSPAVSAPDEQLVLQKLMTLKGAGIFSEHGAEVFQLLKSTEPFLGIENLEELIDRVWERTDGTK